MLMWTLLSHNCSEYYTEQPADQTAQSLRQKRQFPHREFTSLLRERERKRGTQGGRERRSESKGWKSVVESKRWLLPEVICLSLLSLQMLEPLFSSKDLRFFARTLISYSNSICEIVEPLCDLEHIAELWSLIQFLLLAIWCWKDETKTTYSFCQ